jgi:hypothetical protein
MYLLEPETAGEFAGRMRSNGQNVSKPIEAGKNLESPRRANDAAKTIYPW